MGGGPKALRADALREGAARVPREDLPRGDQGLPRGRKPGVPAGGRVASGEADACLSRTLGQNMVTGVAEGWSKQLKLVGVGYRAEANPKAITLSLGYSHPVVMEIPEGLKVEVAKGNTDHRLGDRQGASG